MNKKKTQSSRAVSEKDVPATAVMLELTRTELKSDIQELRSEMNTRFKEIDARFKQVDARFDRVDARFEQLMGAIHHMASEVSRVGTIVEEQNSRNKIVMENMTTLFHRQDRVETLLSTC